MIAARHVGGLTAAIASHAARLGIRGRGALVRSPSEGIDAGIAWLVRSHDVTGRQGSSRGYSLLDGWRPAFPETTGYVIGTLMARAAQNGDGSLADRALEMAEWELSVQGDDGGIMEGVVSQRPARSIVFNTGMVMHGWLDAFELTREQRF